MMADLTIRDDLAKRLREIAQQEQRSVDEVLGAMIDHYRDADSAAGSDPVEAFIGAFDDEVSDLSTTVRETMQTYYRRKYGRTG
jgi:hypothetical protein